MKPRDYIKVSLGSLVLLILVILFWQNAGTDTQVTVVMFGERSGPMPLSIPIVISYISGGVIGGLLLLNWRVHDTWRDRKTKRVLQRLEDQLYDLEERLDRRSDYLLPSAVDEAEVQARERLSVDDFGIDDDEPADLDRGDQEEDYRDYRDEDPDEEQWREERRWDY